MKSSMKSALPCAATLWPHPLSSSWRLLGERSLLWIQPVQKPAVKTVPAVTHTEESVASNNPKQRQTPEPCKCRSIKHIHIWQSGTAPSISQTTHTSCSWVFCWSAACLASSALASSAACLSRSSRSASSLAFFLSCSSSMARRVCSSSSVEEQTRTCHK